MTRMKIFEPFVEARKGLKLWRAAPRERSADKEPLQGASLEVPVDQVGQSVEAAVERGDAGTEQCVQHRRRLEQAVRVQPQHMVTLPADRCSLRVPEHFLRARGSGGQALGLPLPDLVAVHRQA